MRYSVIVLSLALGACAAGYVPPPEQIVADSGRVTDAREIVVLSEDDAAIARLTAEALPLGYSPVSDVPTEALGLTVRVLEIPADQSGPGAIRELEALEPGVLAGVNHAYDARNEMVERVGRSYADDFLRWPAGGCPALRPVGVIDAAPRAGVRDGTVHRAFFRGAATRDDHGWVVADLIADPARLTGARVYMADVVGRSRNGEEAASVDAIVAALAWMHGEGVDLVNISLAGPYNKILDRTFAQAAERNMIIVSAVGNEGPEGPPRFPAAFPGVIAVTAVDAESLPYERALAGSHVAVAAPGVDIFVDGRYVSGTSYSAAFVTSFLASRDRSLTTPADARRMLGRHVRKADARMGMGILDLANSCD